MKHLFAVPCIAALSCFVVSVTTAVTEEHFLRMQAEAQYKIRTSQEGTPEVIQQVSANGQRSLRPFTIKDRWEIQWESKGQMLIINIYDTDGKLLRIAATQEGAGKGSSYQPKGGDYYLQVTGMGEWTVTVVQLP